MVTLKCFFFSFQELIQKSQDVRSKSQHSQRIPEHQTFLEEDLHKAQVKLKSAERQLEEIASQQSRWEHEMLILRQQLQTSATKDMKFGINQSVETLHIEAELAHIQQKAFNLTTKRSELVCEIQKWMPEYSSSGSQNGHWNGVVDYNTEDLKKQPKTVRMVKRDSKDRFFVKQTQEPQEQEPPPTLPRGSSQNVHDFLTHQGKYEQQEQEQESELSKSSTLPRSFRQNNGGPSYASVIKPSMIHGKHVFGGYKRKVRLV
jgi:hypothetical protein